MESVFKSTIASRGWHVYQQTVWHKPKIGEKLTACKEKYKVALEIDPYAVAWKLKKIDRIAPVVVGHIPREISRAIWFFLEKGGTVTGKVFEERCRPSPIPKGGLEILLHTKISIADGKRKYLDRLKCIISENYDPSSETEMLSFREGKELEEEKQRQEEMIDFEQVIVFEDDDDEVEDVGGTPESKPNNVETICID